MKTYLIEAMVESSVEHMSWHGRGPSDSDAESLFRSIVEFFNISADESLNAYVYRDDDVKMHFVIGSGLWDEYLSNLADRIELDLGRFEIGIVTEMLKYYAVVYSGFCSDQSDEIQENIPYGSDRIKPHDVANYFRPYLS